MLPLVVALLILAASHYYLWRRLVHDVTAPRGKHTWRVVGTCLVCLLGLCAALALVGTHTTKLPAGAERVLAWTGYPWLGLAFFLVLALLIGEVLRRLLVAGLQKLSQTPAYAKAPESFSTQSGTPDDGWDKVALNRRVFAARAVAVVATTAATVTAGYGATRATFDPRVERLTVALVKLPPSANGFRIALVSDVHLGPLFGRRHLQRIVDTINREKPDLVALVGNLADGGVAELRSAAEPLAGLRAGHRFFVTGDDDHAAGSGRAQDWVAHLRTLGIRTLLNEHVTVAGFDLAGVDARHPDVARALSNRDERHACVVLAHQPAIIHQTATHGIDLQLSSRVQSASTWPSDIIAEWINPHEAGLHYTKGFVRLYITEGAGTWGPPMRVGAPPGIAILTLKAPEPS